MALDHYVSQVHLRQFWNPSTEKLLAVTKVDQRLFWPSPKNVCAVNEGNTNQYLTEQRLIERLFSSFETLYPSSLEDLRAGKNNSSAREVFASFAAGIASASPTFDRLNKPGTIKSLSDHAKMLHSIEPFPPYPNSSDPRYAGRSLPELLDEGLINIEVDMKMPQAMLATKLENLVLIFANADWEILHIETPSKLLTSDYPFAIVPPFNFGAISRLLPLAPDLGVIIHPNRDAKHSHLRQMTHYNVTSQSKVVDLNRAIVWSAEKLIFTDELHPWLVGFVGKNKDTILDVDPKTGNLAYSKI